MPPQLHLRVQRVLALCHQCFQEDTGGGGHIGADRPRSEQRLFIGEPIRHVHGVAADHRLSWPTAGDADTVAGLARDQDVLPSAAQELRGAARRQFARAEAGAGGEGVADPVDAEGAPVLAAAVQAFQSAGSRVLGLLALMHIGAALMHRFILKDGVFARMWPGAGGKP